MEPITVTIADARKALGLGRTKIYDLMESGKLRSTKIGTRRLIYADSIRQLVEAA